MDFVEMAKDMPRAAPTAYRTKSGKRKRATEADRVKDLEEVDSSDFSTDKEIEAAFPAKPVASHPPPEVKKSQFDSYGIGDS
jgi:hypothetical protein